MNLKQALYITTIAETGSITQAAKKLYISQPSLSQMLKQVEEEIGLKIFDRSSLPFKPTYAGERYLHAAETMLATNETLEVELESIRHENSGRLRFGLSVSRAIQYLPDLIMRFDEQYPNVTLKLVEGGSGFLEQKLINQEIDLAFAIIDNSTLPNLEYELLELESIGVLAGEKSDLAASIPNGTPITIRDLKDDPFISLTEGHSIRYIQNDLFREHNFNPQILLETDSINLAHTTVLKTRACMLCPDVYNNDTVRIYNGSFYPLLDVENTRHFYACWRKGDYQPKYVRDFINLMKTVILEQENKQENKRKD